MVTEMQKSDEPETVLKTSVLSTVHEHIDLAQSCVGKKIRDS
jgi:hypothetical protein